MLYNKHTLLPLFVKLFDTIHITPPEQITHNLKLDNVNYQVDNNAEIISSKGNIEGIILKTYMNSLRIECSLPKLLKGNNIYSLNYSEVDKAIELISEKIGIDISNWIVRRLDIEGTFPVSLPVTEYYKYLGDSPYYRRNPLNKTSLYYKNDNRAAYFYDKIRERKKRRISIPPEFDRVNLMRFEVRYNNTFLKNIASKCNKDYLTVADILKGKIYKRLIEMWKNEYDSILKINKPHFDFLNISGKKEFVDQLALKGIEALGGVNAVLEMIDASRPYNLNARPEYFSRRKKGLKEISLLEDLTIQSHAIEELNRSIRLIYNSQLSLINTNLIS